MNKSAEGISTMQFTSKHSRAFIGNDITVTVCADAKESISRITVTLDDVSLEEQVLGEGTESYIREFHGVGDAGPGKDHILIIKAWDQGQTPHSSRSEWTDAI
jgi:hypothetical protein